MSYHPPKEETIGPLDVVALMGEYRVIDRGAGSRVLAPKFTTRASAWVWMTRQGLSQKRDATTGTKGERG
jgi:hypothetical protein